MTGKELKEVVARIPDDVVIRVEERLNNEKWQGLRSVPCNLSYIKRFTGKNGTDYAVFDIEYIYNL